MQTDRQLYELDYAVERHPDAPVNYLLRGEYWLSVGDIYQAREDLTRARDLAAELYKSSDWGYIYQSYIDRAEAMLRWLNSKIKSHR